MQEVVALEQLVGELCEGQAVAGCAVETLLHRILCHHIVYGDMLADGTCELKEGEVLHPVVVVDHLGSIRLVGIEIEEFSHLCLDALLIMVQGVGVKKVALL